jgi:sporulation protein YlmC with PRC-barrel domain
MAAFDPATLDRWRALAIVDRDGTTVGTISEFYLDRETGHPTWALVETGLFGATQTFVPLVHATEIADGLQVPYEKRHIKDSPRVDPHDELTPDEEARLFAHYGVDYAPAAGPGPADGVAAGPEALGAAEGPGPVPVDVATEQEVGAAPDAPGTAAEPGPVPAEPGTTEGPGPVPGEPGTIEGPGPVPEEPGTIEGPGPGPEEPGTTEDPEMAAGSSTIAADRGAGPAEPGLAEAPASDPLASEAPPGTVSGEPGTAEGPGRVPPEAGPGGPEDATLSAPRGFGQAEHPDDAPDPDLSRTAPVEPGLPGSTAASPGAVPTTVDKDTADPDGRTADDPFPDPDDPRWPPASAGSFDEHPIDRPANTSDRWREAKLAAERERLAREAAQPEERSPLERARRRLERLVGVGQDHSDDDITAPDREAAERARRARLGFDEDDPRFR